MIFLRYFFLYVLLLIISASLSVVLYSFYIEYRFNKSIELRNSARFKNSDTSSMSNTTIANIQILPYQPIPLYIKSLNNDSFILDIDSNEKKTLFLNVWETWCGPCIAEFPSLERFVKDYKNTNTSFYFVSSENVEKLKNFKNDKKFNLPFYSLDDKTNIKKGSPLHSNSIPFTLIVVPKKKLMLRINGAVDWDDPNLRSALSCYLQ
jgi:thiol-disulfide isomerase/thioredoxin